MNKKELSAGTNDEQRTTAVDDISVSPTCPKPLVVGCASSVKVTAKEKALKLCQEIGITTLFDKECNNGYTLPLHVSKKIAFIIADEMLSVYDGIFGNDSFWNNVKKEIEKL